MRHRQPSESKKNSRSSLKTIIIMKINDIIWIYYENKYLSAVYYSTFKWWLIKWLFDNTSPIVSPWHLYHAILWRKTYITELVNSGTNYRPIEDHFQDPMLDLKIRPQILVTRDRRFENHTKTASLVRIPKRKKYKYKVWRNLSFLFNLKMYF